MAIVQEIVDVLSKIAKFTDIVYEFEQGLYLRNGIVRERKRKRLSREDKTRIKAEEIFLRKGSLLEYFPFRRPEMPEGFRRSWITGFPTSNERYSKILDPGLYFFPPWIGYIHTDSKKEKPLDLKNTSTLTVDEPSVTMNISCNLLYEIKDLYLVYTEVTDYEGSLKKQALSILSRNSRGKKFAEWKDPEKIKDLEERVLAEVQEKAAEWGLNVYQVTITDNIPCKAYKFFADGEANPGVTTIPLE